MAVDQVLLVGELSRKKNEPEANGSERNSLHRG
jgi:hypothetical protein